MKQEQPYNPLDKENLGLSVAEALLSRPVEPLPPGDIFLGAGIYVIYYWGDFPAYAPLAERNREAGSPELPIYVGRATPKGGRKGSRLKGGMTGPVLYKRLMKHADSIREAKSLDLQDFSCRYLVVDEIWIPLAESLLIEQFLPPWNLIVEGFGNHDPGSGRYNQQRSPWDVLHPGRKWVERCQVSKKTPEQILVSLERHFAGS